MSPLLQTTSPATDYFGSKAMKEDGVLPAGLISEEHQEVFRSLEGSLLESDTGPYGRDQLHRQIDARRIAGLIAGNSYRQPCVIHESDDYGNGPHFARPQTRLRDDSQATPAGTARWVFRPSIHKCHPGRGGPELCRTSDCQISRGTPHGPRSSLYARQFEHFRQSWRDSCRGDTGPISGWLQARSSPRSNALLSTLPAALPSHAKASSSHSPAIWPRGLNDGGNPVSLVAAGAGGRGVFLLENYSAGHPRSGP